MKEPTHKQNRRNVMEKQTKKRTFQPNRYCHNCRYGGQRASCRKDQQAITPYDWCYGWKK